MKVVIGVTIVVILLLSITIIKISSLNSLETEKIIEVTPTTIPSPTVTPTPPPLKLIHYSVPFTSQSPLAQWSDPRQQDACEEASVLMAIKWVKGELIANKTEALKEILDISLYQTNNFASFHDTSSKDTIERIIKGYYKYENVVLQNNIEPSDIINALQNDSLVITPMNGREMKNPHFTAPGPERHMVLIIGYDPETEEFITNDPGIAEGKDYRYPKDVFFSAIRDYPTGNHEPINVIEKNMIVIKK